jgi:hypothetical protein
MYVYASVRSKRMTEADPEEEGHTFAETQLRQM